MLIVIDDVLNETVRHSIANHFVNDPQTRMTRWLNKEEIGLTPLVYLVEIAKNYFNLESLAGCEYWAHYGTKPDWHVDKDELLMKRTGKLATPIISMVYYAEVKDLIGGKFMTKTETIIPVANRLIMFSPNVLHGVEEYTGTRLSVAINPWLVKPEGY
jgi:hypothetical protein